MIGAYFAEDGAPVASIPTSSVNISVGGTVPDSVALFPPPYDLVSQVSDPDFHYLCGATTSLSLTARPTS